LTIRGQTPDPSAPYLDGLFFEGIRSAGEGQAETEAGEP
jgi:hypothetical protein